MELRHLRYFVAVAEELHFGRAAMRVHIAQPPLSQQIRALETELGIELFIRTRRHVELTHAGGVFLTEARAILSQADRAVELAQRAARGQVGQLRVGFVGSAMYDDFVPSILRTYRDQCPEVELVLEEMTTTQQAERLREGTLDVGFARPPVGDDAIIADPIRRESLYAALPSRHRLAGAHTVSLLALANDAFVMLPRRMGLGFYDQVMSLCREAGFEPRVAQEAAEMHTIVSLVAAGIGVSIVPDSARNLRAESVTYLPFDEPNASTEMAVTYRRDDPSQVVHTFLNVVYERRDKVN